MPMKIGCDNLHYAIMTTEDTPSSAPVYGAIKSAPGVMHVNINPNASLATAFFDDGPGDTAATLGNIEVEIQKNVLTAENKADLLGHTLDANGGIMFSGEDTPPYVAIGFRSLKSNGKYRYVWLYKGRFSDPEDNSETKADSINFQSDTITGQFVKLAYPVTVNEVLKRPWKYEIDSDTPTANQTTMDGWFDSITMPSSVVTAPAISATFAIGSTSGTTSATISGSVGAGNSFAYKVTASTVATPNVSDSVSGTTAYISGADIEVTALQYVSLYELSSTGTVVKFLCHQVTGSEIAE